MNIASLLCCPLDPSFQDKSEVSKKYQLTGYEWTQNASFASVFQKFSRGDPTPPPPYCESIKNSPLLAVYDPLQLSWKFSRNTYFEDRSFEGKNYIQFCGKKSTRTRQKMGSECTICIHFSKIFSGRPRPPPPLLQEHKKLPSLVVYDPLQLSWKFSRNMYVEDRSFEGKNYTQFLGK